MSKTGLGTIKGRLVLGAGLALAAGGCSTIRDHRGFLVDQTLVESVQDRKSVV